MATQHYILSTLSADNTYHRYAKAAGAGAPRLSEASVTIKGRAGLPDKNLIVKNGVVTPVTSEDLSWLKDNNVFKQQERNGFLTIMDKAPADADKAAKDQAQGDGGSLLTEEQVKAKQPSVKAKKG